MALVARHMVGLDSSSFLFLFLAFEFGCALSGYCTTTVSTVVLYITPASHHHLVTPHRPAGLAAAAKRKAWNLYLHYAPISHLRSTILPQSPISILYQLQPFRPTCHSLTCFLSHSSPNCPLLRPSPHPPPALFSPAYTSCIASPPTLRHSDKSSVIAPLLMLSHVAAQASVLHIHAITPHNTTPSSSIRSTTTPPTSN